MAKKSSRNFTQLRKDNRTSNIVMLCSRKGCKNEALLIKGPTACRTKICKSHWLESKNKKPKRIVMLHSMGLC